MCISKIIIIIIVTAAHLLRTRRKPAAMLLLLLLPLFTRHDVLKSSNGRMGRLNSSTQYNIYSMQSDWKVSACVRAIAYYYKICVIVYRYENARFFFFQTTLELLIRSNILYIGIYIIIL